MFKGLKHILCVGIVLLMGCGTGIGNPTSSGFESPIPNNSEGEIPSFASNDFEQPIIEYAADTSPSLTNGQECGEFTENSTQLEIDEGRECVREAFASCHPARYLINQTTALGRFVSYVAIRLTHNGCEIYAHTVSNNQSIFSGDSSQSCDTLTASDLPELACVEKITG